MLLDRADNVADVFAVKRVHRLLGRFLGQHAVSTAAALFRHLDFRRSYAGRPIVGDDLL
jgi:hypothetical protein